MSDEQTEVEELETENVEELENTEGEDEEVETDDGELEEEDEWQPEEISEDEKPGEPEEEKPKPEKSLKQKKKLKGLVVGLETELTEREKELERLRLENEELRARSVTSNTPAQLKRPLERDFTDEYGNVDEEGFTKALDDYEDKRYEQRRADKKAKQAQEIYRDTILSEVEEHNERVKKFLGKSTITEDKHAKATKKFVNFFEDRLPGKGKEAAEKFISAMGQGSEKTVYFAGDNESFLDKMDIALRKDPDGFKLFNLLATENARLRGLTVGKPKTKAPAPAATANGDISTAPGTVKDSRLKKQYDAAHKKNDDDAAWEIRKKAKSSGVDVTSW